MQVFKTNFPANTPTPLQHQNILRKFSRAFLKYNSYKILQNALEDIICKSLMLQTLIQSFYDGGHDLPRLYFLSTISLSNPPIYETFLTPF